MALPTSQLSNYSCTICYAMVKGDNLDKHIEWHERGYFFNDVKLVTLAKYNELALELEREAQRAEEFKRDYKKLYGENLKLKEKIDRMQALPKRKW